MVASQDTAAFGELIRRHQSQVRNFLRKLTRDETLADDLAQDCFLHAWNKIHTYSGTGSFIGWVLKIAYTTFLQSKRKSKRYAEILEEVGHAVAFELELAEASGRRDGGHRRGPVRERRRAPPRVRERGAGGLAHDLTETTG